MSISSIISNLATAEGQYRHRVDYKQKRPKFPQLYLLIFLEIELEVKSIEFLIFLGFGIEASISFALHASRVSRPFILPLNPYTNARKQVQRPSSFPIIHYRHFRARWLFAYCWKIIPIGVSTSIDVIMKQKTVQSVNVWDNSKIAALESRIKLNLTISRNKGSRFLDI